jgi:hypothetical protein
MTLALLPQAVLFAPAYCFEPYSPASTFGVSVGGFSFHRVDGSLAVGI